MPKRVAAFLAAILFALALGFTLAPTSHAGITCGEWFSPNWTFDGAAKAADNQRDLEQALEGVGMPDLLEDGPNQAEDAYERAVVCADKLDFRRNATVGLLFLAGCALVAPFVIPDNSRRRDGDDEPVANS